MSAGGGVARTGLAVGEMNLSPERKRSGGPTSFYSTRKATGWCHPVVREILAGAKRGTFRGGHKVVSWLSSRCSSLYSFLDAFLRRSLRKLFSRPWSRPTWGRSGARRGDPRVTPGWQLWQPEAPRRPAAAACPPHLALGYTSNQTRGLPSPGCHGRLLPGIISQPRLPDLAASRYLQQERREEVEGSHSQ